MVILVRNTEKGEGYAGRAPRAAHVLACPVCGQQSTAVHAREAEEEVAETWADSSFDRVCCTAAPEGWEQLRQNVIDALKRVLDQSFVLFLENALNLTSDDNNEVISPEDRVCLASCEDYSTAAI